jgi:HEPN domain-containing protein
MENDYKIWIDRAKSSLAISKNKSDECIFFEDLCFQAQQAVEKAIKGLLIFCNVEPEKTHNLVLLIKELSNYFTVPEEINDTVILNDYAVQTRYPGEYTPIEEDEYNEAIRIAENCVSWIKNKIKTMEKKITNKEKDQPYLDKFETENN